VVGGLEGVFEVVASMFVGACNACVREGRFVGVRAR
jgi:hypothetical protein